MTDYSVKVHSPDNDHREENLIRIVLKRLDSKTMLLYRLTEELLPSCHHEAVPCYSLSVTKIDYSGLMHETKALTDIARYLPDALKIFYAVSQGLVTPCTVYDVVSDLICEL